MKIQFYLRFYTQVGQSLWISHSGKSSEDSMAGPIAMNFLNKDFWQASLEIKLKSKERFAYKYFLKNK
ncbi:MAG: hypothetical protein ABUT20_48965, partial [Bacteroidota bacterium]